MKCFKDKTDREWEIDITVAAVKRVRDLVGVDLLDMVKPDTEDKSEIRNPNSEIPLLLRISADPVLLVDCLYAVCRPAAIAAGISDEAFGEALAGDCIAAATTAFLGGLVDFFPSARDRARLEKVLEETTKLTDLAGDLLDAKLQTALTDGSMEAAVRKTLGKSSPTPPESSE